MIYLASDHAGYKLKEMIKIFLEEKGLRLVDVGPHTFDSSDDYPDFIIPCAKKVAQNPKNKGIILGGSGQGEAIAANKVKKIRAVVYYGGPENLVKLSREHNAANMLSLGARFLKPKQALKAVQLWLDTPFSQDKRHVRRIKKIGLYENK